MTEKEVAVLRRRFKADKSNITRVKGCYVNASREIVCTFDQPIITLGQEESEMLLTNLRKTCPAHLAEICWILSSTRRRWPTVRNTSCS